MTDLVKEYKVSIVPQTPFIHSGHMLESSKGADITEIQGTMERLRFSRQLVSLLRDYNVTCDHLNIPEDESVREGMK